MTVKREYDKKKLIILRAALITIGAAVGATAVWQYFMYFPDIVRSEFKAMIIIVSAVLLAALLGLSAKPVYRLGAGIAESMGGVASRLGGKGVAAIVLGLVAAAIAVLLIDVVMATFEKLWAVRLLVDTLVYIIFSAVCCYGFTHWLTVPDAETDEVDVKRGYLLAAECLTDERVLTAVDTLINVKVSDGAYKALCLFGGDADAIRRLDTLVSLGVVELVRCKKQFGGQEEYRAWEKQTAVRKRLKYVTTAEQNESDVTLCSFVAPSEQTKEKYKCADLLL